MFCGIAFAISAMDFPNPSIGATAALVISLELRAAITAIQRTTIPRILIIIFPIAFCPSFTAVPAPVVASST